MMNEDKKCPACGKEGWSAVEARKYYIGCLSCGFRTHSYDYAGEAWAAWNNRPAEDKLKAELEQWKRDCDALAYVIDDAAAVLEKVNE